MERWQWVYEHFVFGFCTQTGMERQEFRIFITIRLRVLLSSLAGSDARKVIASRLVHANHDGGFALYFRLGSAGLQTRDGTEMYISWNSRCGHDWLHQALVFMRFELHAHAALRRLSSHSIKSAISTRT